MLSDAAGWCWCVICVVWSMCDPCQNAIFRTDSLEAFTKVKHRRKDRLRLLRRHGTTKLLKVRHRQSFNISICFTIFHYVQLRNLRLFQFISGCFVRFLNWNMWTIQNYPDLCAIMQVWDIRMSCVCDLQSVFVSRGIMQRMPAKSSRAATSCPSCLHFFQV